MTHERHSINLDMPRPLYDLIRECETNCVAGCCGLDAFVRAPSVLLPWLDQHREQFSLVMDQLADTMRLIRDHRGAVHSEQHEFNHVWTSAECEQFLREWRQTIFEAATIAYGGVLEFDPAWRTFDVVALAKGIYDDRAFDRLPILADALQDAGCTNEGVLSHCRNEGVHARGCWVVDLVLGKV